jgi:UDP-glucose:(heptosyl)LPS alpha-1,3-glucosyltransferase
MKIALVLERFDPQGGGLEQWAWQLAQALAERKHHVTVLAFRYKSQWLPSGIDVRVLPWRESRVERADVADRALAEIDADVSHDLGVGCSAAVLHPQMGCRLANYRREIRSLRLSHRIFRMIHPAQRRWLREVEQLERRQYRKESGVVIAVSRLVSRDLQDFHGVPQERIHIIPNGVDLRRFSPALAGIAATSEDIRKQFDLTENGVFLFAALNPRLKGVQPLLKAFAKAERKRPGLRLLVIGKEASPALLRFVQKHQLQHAVKFAGFVSDARPYFAAADVFVLPSYYDACSLGVLEACAMGLPVITTRQNGASELLTDGQEGRILEQPDDLPALQAALLELADPAVRDRMRSKALELASRCTLERNVDELERLYAEVLRRPRQMCATG